MSLEIALAENTAAIRELIAKLSSGPVIAQDVQAEKPAATTKATKATKADPKPEAAPSSEPTPTASDNSQPSSTESNEASENVQSETTEQSTAQPTYEDAKAAVLNLGKVKGRQATLDVLSRFGAAKLPDVKPEAFADLIALAQSVIDGGEV